MSVKILQTARIWLVWSVLLVTTAWAALAAADPVPPHVLTMPSGQRAGTIDTAYAWANNPVYFWGRVKWGSSTTGTYAIDCKDGTPVKTGNVTSSNRYDIGANCTYASAGIYTPSLKVTDSNGLSDVTVTTIQVLPTADLNAKTNLAIERGLKYMYNRYIAQGLTGEIYTSTGMGSQRAQTAAAVLAFENRGHTPALDENGDGVIDAADRAIKEAQDIYGDVVHKGLDYILNGLTPVTLSIQSGNNPDLNGNGKGLTDSTTQNNRDGYTVSMIIMALVGAGKPDGNPATLDATDIRALVGNATYVKGRRFYDIVQDLCEWYYYGQESSGGWRYYANYGSSDNSVSQWPALGIDEAHIQWTIPVPTWVTNLNQNWTNATQHGTKGQFGYQGTTGGITMVMTGAGLAQLFMQGLPANDTKVTKALGYIDGNWYVDANMYTSYGVTKAMRMARDPANPSKRKTIVLIPPSNLDWYNAYANYLISQQKTDGHWESTGYEWNPDYAGYSLLPTAWAVEILTPALTGQPPVADAGGPYTVNGNTAFTLDGCKSRHEDPNKYLVLYEWDIDNNGSYDYQSSNCTQTVPGYPETGSDYSKIVVLRVTDNFNETATDAATVNVTTGNVAPVAVAGGPYKGAVGFPITLDGSGSYDPNAPGACGTIVNYKWDVDGNGTFETDAGNNPTYSVTFNRPYYGSIGLQVTDNCGKSSTSATYAEISVSDLRPDHYQIVRMARISRFVREYEVRFFMRNVGSANVTDVVANLIQKPANITVMDGNVTLGTIPSSQTVPSSDTFTIRVDEQTPTPDTNLKWRVTFNQGASSVDMILPW